MSNHYTNVQPTVYCRTETLIIESQDGGPSNYQYFCLTVYDTDNDYSHFLPPIATPIDGDRRYETRVIIMSLRAAYLGAIPPSFRVTRYSTKEESQWAPA